MKLLLLLAFLPLLLGATEINIGQNNTVVTGGVTGGNCLEGNGSVEQEERQITPVREVAVDGAFDVKVVCGGQMGVQVTGDSNLLPVIQTKVVGTRLEVTTSKSICTTNPLIVEIFVSELSYLSAIGSSDLSLNCSAISLPQLEIVLTGSTSLKAVGVVKKLSVKLDGSSEIDAAGLVAKSVSVDAGGSTEALLFASEKISGTSRDASDVIYMGSPAVANVSAADASDFAPAD